jgi:hypothetical protein
MVYAAVQLPHCYRDKLGSAASAKVPRLEARRLLISKAEGPHKAAPSVENEFAPLCLNLSPVARAISIAGGAQQAAKTAVIYPVDANAMGATEN